MKDKNFNLLHIFIAAVAIINLAALFLFQYGLSDNTPAIQAAQRASKERAANESSENATQGTTELLSAEGEATEAAAGSENAASQTSGSAETASANTSAGAGEGSEAAGSDDQENASEESSSRNNGEPSITVSERLPQLGIEDLPNLVSVLSSFGYISADDGYGNDITDQIVSDYEEISSETMEYKVTFTVTNRAGRSVSEVRTITVEAADKPILELTADTVNLSVGSTFNFMSYVKTARDIDGSSLDTRISLSGAVDTSTRGTYTIEYSTVSRVNSERASATLTVHVE